MFVRCHAFDFPSLVCCVCMNACCAVQLMYDKSGGGEQFRRYTSVNLGWWHTYKHMGLKVWKLFAPTIIAPVWNHLYPGSQFHLRPKSFPSVLFHLLMLHLAFPKIKERLDKTKESQDEHLTNLKLRVAVKDIEFLFEFAIPVVSSRDSLHLTKK